MFTDHEESAYAITSPKRRIAREERQLAYVAKFTSDNRHVAGVNNVIPDAR